MMALALALVIAAVVVSVTLGSEPERVVAAEVATKSPGEAPRYSSGEEGSATKNSSSEKESPRYPSGRRSRWGTARPPLVGRWGSARRKLRSRRPVLQQEAEPPNSQSPMPQPAGQQTSF